MLLPNDSPPAGPRLLAHVDMDAFYASVEILDRPALKGKPVIVGGGGSRGVVSAASYAARAFGVHSAMPIFQARRLCPQGVFLPVNMGRYQRVSRQVMEILGRFTPVVEQVSVDEAYLDLTGTAGLWGPPLTTGRRIQAEVLAASGLTCSVGLAPVRFLCKIASTRHKPGGLFWAEDVEAFLVSIRLAEVPGVGQKAEARLADLGLRRLVDLRPLGRARLESLLGAMGSRLWELAWGKDDSPVSPARVVKSVSHEETLAQDTADHEQLAARLLGQSHRVAHRLRRQGLAGRTVVLKLKTATHQILSRSRTLPVPTDQGPEIYRVARELLAEMPHPGPFRLVGVGVASLDLAGRQPPELFGREQREKSAAVGRAQDEVWRRFGKKALLPAGTLTVLDRGDRGGHNEDTGP
ncbi:MAG: DNA polymerase IV [Deltaproteobacteria bacterium]|nr:DNA polymerase IV [Deltaproteobacteria bacterium]